MIKFKNVTAALILGLAVAAAATPALAKSQAHRSGHDARAQATSTDIGEDSMSPGRANALRECSAIANRFDQKTWGVYQSHQMRACMTEHGQVE